MRTSKIQYGRQGAPKWLTGSGNDPGTPSMRKSDDGEKKRGKKGKQDLILK